MHLAKWILFIGISCLYTIGKAQSSLHFTRITVDQGLNDGTVQAICHDKMGFMWFSTMGGINRFNGSRFSFFNRVESDSGVVPLSICRSIVLDSSGGLFFGFENGLATFDYSTQTLHMLPAVGNRWILDMFATGSGVLLLSTYQGLCMLHTATQAFTFLPNEAWYGTSHGRVKGYALHGDSIFLLTQAGLFLLDPMKKTMLEVSLPQGIEAKQITHIELDGEGHLWLAQAEHNRLVKLSRDRRQAQYISLPTYMTEWSVTQMRSAPQHPYVWVATQQYGLLQWMQGPQKWIQHQNNPLQPWTPNTNLVRTMHIDNKGLVWFGGDYGVNYTNPSRSLFTIIPSFDKETTQRNRRIARVATEDTDGNLWLATIDGVVSIERQTGRYKEYNNRAGRPDVLYANSVRSVHAAADGKLWIATAKGINYFDKATGKIHFVNAGDSIGHLFFFSINAGHDGTLWFSSRDGDGLYYLPPGHRQFLSIRQHTHLQAWAGRGFRYVYHDTKGRYWMGFNGEGLGMYEPATGRLHTWNSVAGSHDAIAGNYIVDIKEDKDGYVWVSTFNGLSRIHPANLRVNNYTTQQGLLSNTASALGIDSLNRVWIATARGLMVLDEERTYFTSFTLPDGLPSISFTEQPGYEAPNGDFIMGTLNGFIRFNPLNFKPVPNKLPCFISDISISNRNEKITHLTTPALKLAYYENSFQLQLTGVNYDNPAQTWYAYKLDGFEENWHYTQDGKVVYTNLAGGAYKLLYKAGTDANRWADSVEVLYLQVGTIFYKSAWFWMLIVVLVGGLLYWVYQYRLTQQQRYYLLESKTQKLEKEKALVMYENLKQHLNPHFLFNSLSSLGSLIRANQLQAVDFLERMSKIYRYILKNRESEKVSLQEELNFVSHFIELQKARFEEGLQVKIDIPEAYLEKKIAPVTLQNLLENAIKHNTTSRSKPLQVALSVEGDYLIVKNRLQRKSFVETSNETGLQSMQHLYSYLSDRPLMVEEDGEIFVVKIPLL